MEIRQKELIRLVARFGERCISGVEMGAQSGQTSAHLLRAYPRLTMSLVDPWQTWPVNHSYRMSGDPTALWTHQEAQYQQRAARDNTAFAKERCCIFVGLSLDIAKEFRDETVEFVFIDAEHTYDAVLADSRAWWPKLRIGQQCFLVFHDYGDMTGHAKGVTPAVKEFAAEVGREIHEGYGQMAWIERDEG